MNFKVKYKINIFWKLLKTDLDVYLKDSFDNITNGLIWVCSSTIIFTYIFPKLGMPQSYGAFMLVGSIASWSIFQSYPIFLQIISDLNGNNEISYQLTLPVPYWAVLFKKGVSQACNTAIITLPVIPIGKIILWDRFSLANFSLLKFVLIFCFTHLMTSFLGIFFVGMVKDMSITGNIWCRVIFPIWYLGGAQFPWTVVNKFSPKLGYLFLSNPFLYAIEGFRGAVLGQAGYLPFWTCLSVVVFTTFLLGFFGIKLIKKRLDAV